MKDLITSLKSESVEKKPKKVAKNKVEPQEPDNLELSLVKAIDDFLESSNGVFDKQSNTFAPSSSNQCGRYAVYRFRGYKQKSEFSAQTRRIFDLGNGVEDIVEKLLDSIGILVDSQIEINIEDPPIRGYIDFMIDWNGLKPVECKSINETGFLYRKSYHKPTDNHFRQLQCYLAATGSDSGFLMYYNKNNSALLPLLVKKDDVFLEKLFAKYAKIYEVHKNGDIPVRPYKQTSANCKKCDAYDHCWADSEVGVEIK